MASARQSSVKTQIASGLNLCIPIKKNRLPLLLLELKKHSRTTRDKLKNLNYIHFARFIPAPDKQHLLVVTEFDGELSAYIEDFILELRDAFNLIMNATVDAEEHLGPAPIRIENNPSAFVRFILKHQYDSALAFQVPPLVKPEFATKPDFYNLKTPVAAPPLHGGGADIFSAYPNKSVLDLVDRDTLAEAPTTLLQPAEQIGKPYQVPTVDPADIQANVLHAVPANEAFYLAATITDRKQFKHLLNLLTGKALGGPAWLKLASLRDQPNPKAGETPAAQASWLTLGLTYHGLQKFMPSPKSPLFAEFAGLLKGLNTEHRSFVMGPELPSTAEAVGDVGDSAPANWTMSTTSKRPVDVVITLYQYRETAADGAMRGVPLHEAEATLNAHGLSVVKTYVAQTLSKQVSDRNYKAVHFGYVDGLSQPKIPYQRADAAADDTAATAGQTPAAAKCPFHAGQASATAAIDPPAPLGSFVLGKSYVNPFGGNSSLGMLPETFAENSTFAALRVMEQDAPAFERFLNQYKAALRNGMPDDYNKELLAAKLMGRWRDGSPLSLYPDQAADTADKPSWNEFDYRPRTDQVDLFNDKDGVRCPLGSHIRRMNPRSGFVAGKPFSRRLLRRGMAYGPAYLGQGDDDGVERGLVGLFLCADLHRQYEFILRQWGQGDRAGPGIVGQQDPIIGAQASLSPHSPMHGTYTIPSADGDLTLPMPRLTTTRGSVYLFMPGIKALNHLADAMADAAAPAGTSATTAAIDPSSTDFLRDPYAHVRTAAAPKIGLDTKGQPWLFGDAALHPYANNPKYLKSDPANTRPIGLLYLEGAEHDYWRQQLGMVLYGLQTQLQGELANKVTGLHAMTLVAARRSHVDWIAHFARPLARWYILEKIIGLPTAYIDRVANLAEQILMTAGPTPSPNLELEVRRLMIGLIDMLTTMFADIQGRLIREPAAIADYAGLVKVGLGMAAKLGPMPTDPAELAAYELKVVESSKKLIENFVGMILTGLMPLQWGISLCAWHLLDREQNDPKWLRAQYQGGSPDGLKNLTTALLRFDTPAPYAHRFERVGGTDDKPELKRSTLVWAVDKNDAPKCPHQAGYLFGFPGTGPTSRECLGKDLFYQVMGLIIPPLLGSDLRLAGKQTRPKLVNGVEGTMFRAMAELMVTGG